MHLAAGLPFPAEGGPGPFERAEFRIACVPERGRDPFQRPSPDGTSADFAAVWLQASYAHMKHNKLHGVAHNFADSLAGGLSFVVPGHAIHTHVYTEATANKDGYVIADFLTGEAEGAYPEGELEYALPLFRNAFGEFCMKHGVEASDYAAFLVRFVAGPEGNKYVITIEDLSGRRSSREYVGTAGKRSESLDQVGRRRPNILETPLD